MKTLQGVVQYEELHFVVYDQALWGHAQCSCSVFSSNTWLLYPF